MHRQSITPVFFVGLFAVVFGFGKDSTLDFGHFEFQLSLGIFLVGR